MTYLRPNNGVNGVRRMRGIIDHRRDDSSEDRQRAICGARPEMKSALTSSDEVWAVLLKTSSACGNCRKMTS